MNKEKLNKELQELFNNVKTNIKEIEELAEEKNIYIKIDESREVEKRIIKKYPFTYLSNNRKAYYYINENLINDILHDYENQFFNVLNNIGFISLNEKNQTFKVNKKYGMFSLHYLKYIDEKFITPNFNDNEFIEVIKEYKNGTAEIKFKNSENFKILKKIVFYTNKSTEFILNNITEETKEKFIKASKEKHFNEYYILHQFLEDNFKERNNRERININLIKKVFLGA